jgi:hypothetical protein
MLRFRVGLALAFAAAFVMLSSLGVRAYPGSNVISSTLTVLSPVTLGGTAVKPGTYTVSADDTKVTLAAHGKTVATANVQWKDTPQKSKSTSVLAESGAIKEIHFNGKTRYVEIAN